MPLLLSVSQKGTQNGGLAPLESPCSLTHGMYVISACCIELNQSSPHCPSLRPKSKDSPIVTSGGIFRAPWVQESELPVSTYKTCWFQGAWVARWVERPTSAQVMISGFVSSSPTLGLLLSAQSPLRIFCLPPSAPAALSQK